MIREGGLGLAVATSLRLDSCAWTPASEFGTSGIWWTGDYGLGLNTQPTILNPNFDVDANWTKGAGWTIPGGGGANHAPGATSSIFQTIGVLNNRYVTRYACVSSDGTGVGGQVGVNLEPYAPTVGARSFEYDMLVGTYLGVAAHASSTAVVDDFAASNSSLATWTPKAAKGALVGSTLAQATAGSMPYRSSTTLNGRYVIAFDGTADHAVSSAAATAWPLHQSAGFGLSFVYKPDAGAAATDTILDNCNATNTNHGATVEYDATNQQLVVKIANGSGGFELEKATGAGSVLKGSQYYISLSWSQAGGVRILVNAAAAVTNASGGAASANDATATLQFGRTSGGANFLHGTAVIRWISMPSPTDAALATIHADTKAYYRL